MEKHVFDILDHIPTGSKNAVSRSFLSSATGMKDREMRIEIHKARRVMPILNLSKGRGYFIPDMNEPGDRKLLLQYVRQEESRMKSIGWALKAARTTLRNCGMDWREEHAV